MNLQLTLPSPIFDAVCLIAIASAEAFPQSADPAEESAESAEAGDSGTQMSLPGVSA